MTDLMRVAIKNQRCRLKKRYFNGVPANQIRTTSPVRYMTDLEWRVLTQNVHLAPSTQQAEQAGFTRAENHKTCQSIFPEN
jgi:hypothetical protein